MRNLFTRRRESDHQPIGPTGPTDDSTSALETATRKARHRTPLQDRRQRGPWQRGNAAGVKVFLVLLVGALLTGPAAVAMAIVDSTRPDTVTVPEGSDDSTAAVVGAETKASGVAEALVTRWLGASRADIDGLNEHLVTPADESWLPEDRPESASTVIATQAQPTEGGQYWEVEVSASGGVAGGGERYRVLVDMDLSNPRALALPAIVANPIEDEPTEPIPLEAFTADHGAVKAVDGFGRALLTAETDLERWTAPDTDITEITPAPCAELATTVAATISVPTAPTSNEQVTVLATFACRKGDEVTRAIQYVLDLQGRDGRWEIRTLGNGLSLDSPATPPPPDSTSQPSRTPTPPG